MQVMVLGPFLYPSVSYNFLYVVLKYLALGAELVVTINIDLFGDGGGGGGGGGHATLEILAIYIIRDVAISLIFYTCMCLTCVEHLAMPKN